DRVDASHLLRIVGHGASRPAIVPAGVSSGVRCAIGGAGPESPTRSPSLSMSNHHLRISQAPTTLGRAMGTTTRSRTALHAAASRAARRTAAPRAKLTEPAVGNGSPGRRARSQTIERAALFLTCFSAEEPQLGLADLAARLDLNASTVYRYVATLED